MGKKFPCFRNNNYHLHQWQKSMSAESVNIAIFLGFIEQNYFYKSSIATGWKLPSAISFSPWLTMSSSPAKDFCALAAGCMNVSEVSIYCRKKFLLVSKGFRLWKNFPEGFFFAKIAPIFALGRLANPVRRTRFIH